MRTFEKTHPWLKFNVDLRRLPYTTWIMLGECQSKCQHIAGVPLTKDLEKELYNVYLAKGALASAAIEGNTLTEEETLKRLEGKLDLPPSREYLGQEIDNIVNACNFLIESVTQGRLFPLTASTIKDINRMILHHLKLQEHVNLGEISSDVVGVGRYRGAPREDCAFLLEKLCEWLLDSNFIPQKGFETVYAIIKSIIAHLYLAWIHPFGDGNGRTARLVEFYILFSSGVPSAACHLLSNHYNLTRNEYYLQLDQASRSGGDVIPFITYAVQGFLDGLQEQIERIRQQQWSIAWQSIVECAFEDKYSPADLRRKRFVFDLSEQEDWITVSKLTEITPRVAKDYASKTIRTLTRDINVLVKTGLIEKRRAEVRAKKEIVLAFLPSVAHIPEAEKKKDKV